MNDYEEKLRWSKELADRVKKDYDPYAVIVGLTTGFDSNVALKLATMFLDVTAAFTADTTISAPETLANCERVAKEEYGLRHILRKPNYNGVKEHPNTYFEVVKQHGFPGKTDSVHTWMFRWLKDHAISPIVSSIRKRKHNRNIVIISGARKDESKKRWSTSEDITIRGSNIWVNICNQWSTGEVHAFATDNNLDRFRSPISKAIGMSGDCFCGCYARPGDLIELKIASPSTYEKIMYIWHWLREHTDKDWSWENGPSKQYTLEKYGQKNMFQPLFVPDMLFCSTCMNNPEGG